MPRPDLGGPEGFRDRRRRRGDGPVPRHTRGALWVGAEEQRCGRPQPECWSVTGCCVDSGATGSPGLWSTRAWRAGCETGSRTAWSSPWRRCRPDVDVVRVNKESLNQVLLCEAHLVARRTSAPGGHGGAGPGEPRRRPVPPMGHDRGRRRSLGRRRSPPSRPKATGRRLSPSSPDCPTRSGAG